MQHWYGRIYIKAIQFTAVGAYAGCSLYLGEHHTCATARAGRSSTRKTCHTNNTGIYCLHACECLHRLAQPPFTRRVTSCAASRSHPPSLDATSAAAATRTGMANEENEERTIVLSCFFSEDARIESYTVRGRRGGVVLRTLHF